MKAPIIRKCTSVEDWKDQQRKWSVQNSNIVIEKVVMLNDEEFNDLCKDFFSNREYITKNLKSMWYDDKNRVWHCLCVINLNSDLVILIESEGYDYARYTSVISKQEYIKELS